MTETQIQAESEQITVPATRCPPDPIIFYQLTDRQLEALSNSSISAKLYLAFASFGASALVSFVVCLTTGTFADPYGFAAIVAVTVVCAAMFLFCGILYICQEVKSYRKILQIKSKGAGTPPTH